MNIDALAAVKVARAEAKLTRAKLELSYAVVKAPFNGVVSKVLVAEGDRLQLGAPTVHLFDRSVMQVRAAIPTDYLRRIKEHIHKNEKVTATVEAYGHTVVLDLMNLTSSLSNTGASVDALFQVKESSSWLMLGQILSLSLMFPEVQAVASVPPQALYEQNRVYAIEQGRLVPIDVQLVGETRTNGQHELLLRSNKLQEGMLLLGSHLSHAKEGLKVNPNNQMNTDGSLAVQEPI